MEATENLDAYFENTHFRQELALLRHIALETGAEETMKWGSPVYTVAGGNVFGIMAFKSYYGIWFFNGVFLADRAGVLSAAQQTIKALRQWKIKLGEPINRKLVRAYMMEAIENQKKGIVLRPERKKEPEVPAALKEALAQNKELSEAFQNLLPFRQREYCEHIESAKLEKTRQSRLLRSIPMILKGIGLHDPYRR